MGLNNLRRSFRRVHPRQIVNVNLLIYWTFFCKGKQFDNLIDSYVTDQFSVRHANVFFSKCFCNPHCIRGRRFWQWCSWISSYWIQNCYCLYYMHAVLFFKISMFYKFKFTTTLSLILKLSPLQISVYMCQMFFREITFSSKPFSLDRRTAKASMRILGDHCTPAKVQLPSQHL